MVRHQDMGSVVIFRAARIQRAIALEIVKALVDMIFVHQSGVDDPLVPRQLGLLGLIVRLVIVLRLLIGVRLLLLLVVLLLIQVQVLAVRLIVVVLVMNVRLVLCL